MECCNLKYIIQKKLPTDSENESSKMNVNINVKVNGTIKYWCPMKQLILK